MNKTGWSGVESAMEWLLSHPEGEEGEDEDDDEMQVEAEPAEPKVPLTAEEKAQKVKEMEERRVQKRQGDMIRQWLSKLIQSNLAIVKTSAVSKLLAANQN